MVNVKKSIFNVTAIILMVVVVLGVSYAYFTAGITGVESASTITVTGGTMEIAFAGGKNLEAHDIYPKADAALTKSFSVTGTNTTSINMKYKLTLVVVTNTFSANALSYTLTGYNPSNNGATATNVSNTGIATGGSSIPLGTGYFSNANGIVHTYDLKIYFLDTGEPQNTDQGKDFAGYVKIEGIE